MFRWLPFCFSWISLVASLCDVETLDSLEGVVEARGGPKIRGSTNRPCAWYIRPGMWLESIDLWGHADFSGLGHLSVYTSSVATPATLMTRFSLDNPMPARWVAAGTAELLLVLSAWSNSTAIRLGYHCKPTGYKFGPVYLSPVLYAWVIVILGLMGIMLCLLMAYIACFCLATRSQRYAMLYSRTFLHVDLAQRRRPDAEASARIQSEEQQVMGALSFLPIRRWRADPSERATDACDIEECCLCLDKFEEQDEVRVLPCTHYFQGLC
jgi:hypothetical protein